MRPDGGDVVDPLQPQGNQALDSPSPQLVEDAVTGFSCETRNRDAWHYARWSPRLLARSPAYANGRNKRSAESNV